MGVQLEAKHDGKGDLDRVAELVRRTEGAQRDTEVTADQARLLLLKEDEKGYSHDYPLLVGR